MPSAADVFVTADSVVRLGTCPRTYFMIAFDQTIYRNYYRDKLILATSRPSKREPYLGQYGVLLFDIIADLSSRLTLNHV